MKERVESFIKEKNDEYDRLIKLKVECERNAFLDKYGMYEKVYAPSNLASNDYLGLSDQYPYSEKRGEIIYRYKKVYMSISDEEFEAMKEAADRVSDIEPPSAVMANSSRQFMGFQSKMAIAILVVAMLMALVSFILGIVLGNSLGFLGFNGGIMLLVWVIGGIVTTFILGFATVIDELKKQTGILEKVKI